VIDRRSLLIGSTALFVPAAAEARGMYCTRHPRACRERREREAERWSRLTPEQRAEERRVDAERTKAWNDLAESRRAYQIGFVVASACAICAAVLSVIAFIDWDDKP
jgi:hypothetical protein